MANPNRKPAEMQVRSRPRARVPDLTVVPGRQVAHAPDPKWLKSTKDGWAAFWAADLASAVDAADTPVIQRLFGMRDAQDRAMTRWKKTPYIEGSQGQPVKNPAFDEAMVLERAIVALEDRLGLTPKARANLGIAIGQARLTAEELNRMAEARDDSDEDSGDDWIDA